MADILEGEYAPAWREYRRRARTFWLVCGVGLLLVWGGKQLLAHDHTIAAWALFAPFVVAYGISSQRRKTFACPRCGDFFFWGNVWGVNYLRQRCAHCKLPKWAIKNPEAAV
jgi:hypothetical protein